MMFAPDCGLVKTPFIATHWFFDLDACQPLKSFPLNNWIGFPQTTCLSLFNNGALSPVNFCVFPDEVTIVPVSFPSAKTPSKSMSLSTASHCGGIEKLTLPSLKFTLAIGRALPPSATKYPTKVDIPDNLTSNHDGTTLFPKSTDKSQRPIIDSSIGCAFVLAET